MKKLPINPSRQPTQAEIKRYPIGDFIGKHQLSVIRDFAFKKSEEQNYWQEQWEKLIGMFPNLPKSYETDGQGLDALVYLHYFRGNMDWYITEIDINSDNEGQIQAYGYADIGFGLEKRGGYISIKEIIGHNIEIDLHWKVRSIGEVIGERDGK